MSSAGWLSSVVNQILICAKKKNTFSNTNPFLFFFESSCWKAHDWPLEAAPEEVAQMFLKQCWLHRNDIFSQIRYLSTFLPATTFFQFYLLKREWICAGKRGRELSERMFELWKKYLKSMDSPIVVCLLSPLQALSQPPKLFAIFVTFLRRSVRNLEERNNG